MKGKPLIFYMIPAIVWFAWMATMVFWPSLHEGQVVSIPGVVGKAFISSVYSMAPIGPTTYWCDYELNGKRHDSFNRWELRIITAPTPIAGGDNAR